MMGRWRGVFAAAGGGLLLSLLAGCSGGSPAPAGGKVKVVASIFPLADVAREIGGEHVEVVMLLPAGETPHGFQPKPRDSEALARARLLLTVGLGLDLWADRAAAASGNRALTTLVFAEAVRVEPIKVAPAEVHEEHEAHAEHEEHAHPFGDPHLWLDPTLMKEYTAALAGALSTIQPEHAADFQTRQEAYGAALDRLDEEYRSTLATARIKSFVSFHSAFTYVARRYGLLQQAVLEPERSDVSAGHLERVVEFVRSRGVKVLFAEPQYPRDRLAALAQQTGTTVMTLDPEGNPHVPGHDSYLSLMRTNLDTLAKALECSHAPSSTRAAR
jgi:zinc transport system substrate-binding protein